MKNSSYALTVDGDWLARWQDEWALSPDEDLATAVAWSRAAISEARHRQLSTNNARLAWTAAVEGVWWALALDEVLMEAIGDRYKAARAENEYGRVVAAMRWLRNVHAHRLAVTGRGGAKKDFLPTSSGQTFFYISPSNRWMSADEIDPEGKMRSKNQRQPYDAHVAGLPLDMSLEIALKWFSQIVSASGISGPNDAVDPTVLGAP